MAQVPDVYDIPKISDISVTKKHWSHDIQIIFDEDDSNVDDLTEDENTDLVTSDNIIQGDSGNNFQALDNNEIRCCEFVTSVKCEGLENESILEEKVQVESSQIQVFKEEDEVYDSEMRNEFLRNSNKKICTSHSYEDKHELLDDQIKSEAFDESSTCTNSILNPVIYMDECLKFDNDEIDCDDLILSVNHEESMPEDKVKIECTELSIPKEEQIKEDVPTSSNFSKKYNKLCVLQEETLEHESHTETMSVQNDGLKTKIFKEISSHPCRVLDPSSDKYLKSELIKQGKPKSKRKRYKTKQMNNLSSSQSSTLSEKGKEEKLIKNELFKCNLCHFCKRSAIILSSQTATEYGENKPFKCDQCEYSAGWLHDLIQHKVSKHRKKDYSTTRSDKSKTAKHTENKPVKCDMCNYYTAESDNLPKQKKFKCDMCDYIAIRSDVLSDHKRTKHTKNQFKCDICNYFTSWSSNLQRHKRVKHTENK